MAKKIKKSQILRHVIQLILFLLLPGFYAMTFSELKTVYKMIIGGNFNFLQAFPSLIEFVASNVSNNNTGKMVLWMDMCFWSL